MNDKSISVVIVLQDDVDTLKRALDSVKKQYVSVEEVIVVDTNSSNTSVELFGALAMPNVKLLKQPNVEMAVARNAGAHYATSDYIVFLDANDEWLPFFTFELQRLITRYPLHVAFATRYQFIDANKVPIDAKIKLNNCNPDGVDMHDYFDIAAKGDLPFNLSSFLVKRSFFATFGGFAERNTAKDAQNLYAKTAKAKGIAYSPNIHVHIHTNEKSKKTIAKKLSVAPFSRRFYQKSKPRSLSVYMTPGIKQYVAPRAVLAATYLHVISLYSFAKSLLKREFHL